VIRVGFVGELGYEIHVPMPYGLALWDAIMAAGKEAGIRPFGVEAQRVLRLEKGHIIIGQDSDGLTHPYEIGFLIPKSKTEFLGRVAIEQQMSYGLTRKLVGFRLDDPSLPAPPECCLVIRNGDIAGRVTSAVNSEACGGVIGLAFVAPEDTAAGSEISIKDEAGRMMTAHVVDLPFYDPQNERQAM
jgi:sarcosine oxidase subunit alpha